MISTSIDNHPERNVIRVQLRQNVVLKEMTEAERSDLDEQLVIVDCNKGDYLLHQGVHEMEQYFVLDGLLKRVSPKGAVYVGFALDALNILFPELYSAAAATNLDI